MSKTNEQLIEELSNELREVFDKSMELSKFITYHDRDDVDLNQTSYIEYMGAMRDQFEFMRGYRMLLIKRINILKMEVKMEEGIISE